MTVSIIINTLNRAQSLRVALDSLRRLSYSPFEVIVVNGPSTDDTERVLAEFAPMILIDRCRERNLAVSRNVGLRMASGDLVAFLDDDAVPYEYWLNDLVPHFNGPEVGGVGGFTIDHTGCGFEHCYGATDRLGNAVPNIRKPPDHCCYPGSPIVPFLLGTNAVFRRDVVLAVGGFDEEYEYCFDEVDLCTRIVEAGYLLKQRNCGFVYHKCLPSHIRNISRTRTNWFPIIKNKIYYSIKNALDFEGAAGTAADNASQLVAYVAELVRDDLSAGRITPEQFENFKRDGPAASDAGLRNGLTRGRRLMNRPKTDETRGRFKPFPNTIPETRRTVCLISPDDRPLMPTNTGYIVHVLTKSRDSEDRVDYEDGIWVHRLPGDEQWSKRVALELGRVREMYQFDLVEALH